MSLCPIRGSLCRTLYCCTLFRLCFSRLYVFLCMQVCVCNSSPFFFLVGAAKLKRHKKRVQVSKTTHRAAQWTDTWAQHSDNNNNTKLTMSLTKHVYVHTYVHRYIRVYTCLSACMRSPMCLCAGMCASECTHMHMYIYVCIYMHMCACLWAFTYCHIPIGPHNSFLPMCCRYFWFVK